MEWTKLGTLQAGVAPTYASKCGVYLEVFPGAPRRIIYIGTTNAGFAVRPGEYWEGRISYLRKKHFVFKATALDDIYDKGMRVETGTTRPEYHKHVEYMSGQNQVWIPEEKVLPVDVEKKWKEGEWEQFIRTNFALLELWGCEIKDVAVAEEVESRLQIALGWKFRIGYYQERANRQNWLGAQKKRSQLSGANYKSVLDFSKDNLARLLLDDDALDALDESANRRLLLEYFSHQKDKFCPF